MDQETVDYIITHCRDLMTQQEKSAWHYQLYTLKANASPEKLKFFKEKGWMRETPESLELLKNGPEAFEWETAKRILADNPEKKLLNNCPQCHKLARTPKAKQCRHCGYSWHYNRIAAELTYSEEEDYEYLNIKIDADWLDEKLEALYPGNLYQGLTPTLVSWMMHKEEEELVWKRILPHIGETTVCPILMCPDDNDFSCILIVAEIENCGSYIKWSRLGQDKTHEREAERVGSKVEWFAQPAALKFTLADYTAMLDRFMEQMILDREAGQDGYTQL